MDKISKNVKLFLAYGALMMAFAIAIGAFGAHGLKSIVEPDMLKVFHTGVEYQFYNALGLFAVAFVLYLKDSKKAFIAGLLIFIGMLIFSTSLYFLVILNIPILGVITPIGGTMMVIGWGLLVYSIIKEL